MSKAFTIEEISKYIKGKLQGPKKKVIRGICSIDNIKKDHITYITNEKQLKIIIENKSTSALIPQSFKIPKSVSVIRVKEPKLSFIKVSYLFHPKKNFKFGIHKTAIISENTKINKNVNIGPNTVICKNSSIDNGTTILSNCFIGENVKIGKNVLIYPNVVILDNIVIGNNVIIHSGTVIGSDGFGYFKKNNKHIKIPHNGSVIIEDDVEIGANCTIDRGTIDETIIGEGTKIDNLVQIGHNVKIGKRCIIVAMVGISGSCNIGSDVVLAGQVGIAEHVNIGERTIIGGKSGINTNIPPDSFYSGFPARPHGETLRIYSHLRKLPEISKKILELEKQLKAYKN